VLLSALTRLSCNADLSLEIIINYGLSSLEYLAIIYNPRASKFFYLARIPTSGPMTFIPPIQEPIHIWLIVIYSQTPSPRSKYHTTQKNNSRSMTRFSKYFKAAIPTTLNLTYCQCATLPFTQTQVPARNNASLKKTAHSQ
jgi:hypothetical protein